MAEQMSTEVRQPGDRTAAAGSTQVEAPAEGAAAPIPQAVSAPGINAGTPVVRTEALPIPPMGGNGLAVVRGRKRRYSTLLVCGYLLVLVGFALVFLVPRFKSGWAAKGLMICCGLLMAGGAAAVSLGFVRETMRRL